MILYSYRFPVLFLMAIAAMVVDADSQRCLGQTDGTSVEKVADQIDADRPDEKVEREPEGDPKNEPGAEANEQVTVRGQIEILDDAPAAINLNELQIQMMENVVFEPLPFPENWQEMKPEAREKWFADFQASDQGKAIFDERQKRLESRQTFDVDLRKDGSFSLFDVPRGEYSIEGRIDKEVEGKLFAFEVFGSITIGEVDEVKLAPLPVSVTRLLRVGEVAPQTLGKNASGDDVTRGVYGGQHVLLIFWDSRQEPCVAAVGFVAAAKKELENEGVDVRLVGICLDDDFAAAQKVATENEFTWDQLHGEGWEGPGPVAYGVSSLPTYFLLDGEGNIVVSNAMVYQLVLSGTSNIKQIITDAIAGKDVMDPLTKSDETPAGESDETPDVPQQSAEDRT